MRSWSIVKPLDNWRVQIYLDTNILMFLSEKSYPPLMSALQYLNDKSSFVDLISSEYALFEYLENRKKIHYKRYLAQQNIRETNRALDAVNSVLGRMNLKLIKGSTAFKWNNYYSFNIRGFSYLNVHSEIQPYVNDEIERLRQAYNIDYDENTFNKQLFEPTKRLCLTSRVSRQDCMITTSAVYANDDKKHKDLVIWTGDKDFYDSFHECGELDDIFSDHKPTIEWICRLVCDMGKKTEINLKDPAHTSKISDALKHKLKEYILAKNADSYIGKTAKASKVKDIFFFIPERSIEYSSEGYYLTIIGKELDFIISSKLINSFWLDGSELQVHQYPLAINSTYSGKWEYTESSLESSADISLALKEAGHLLFLTPISD